MVCFLLRCCSDPTIDAVSKGGALAVTVDDWIERYKENQQQAAFELVNFVVQVSIFSSCFLALTEARCLVSTFFCQRMSFQTET